MTYEEKQRIVVALDTIRAELRSVATSLGELEDNVMGLAVLSEDEAPMCAIHKVPMVQVQGKHGLFWSCHQKDSHGKWCSYKPGQE